MPTASKFGGVPVDDEPVAVSKFGGIPVDDRTPPRVGGQKVLDYANETLSNIPASAGRLVSNMASAVAHPIDTGTALLKTAAGAIQKMTPGPAPQFGDQRPYADAAIAGLKDRYGSLRAVANTVKTDPVGVASDVSAVAGGIGGLARGGAAMAGSRLPRVAAAATDIADTAKTVSAITNPMNAVTKPIGSMLQLAARPAIKSALKLPGRTERYGATPARAALEETSGITPTAVKNSAEQRLNELARDVEAKAQQAERRGVTLELTAPRNVVQGAITKEAGANGLVGDLTSMQDQLVTPRPGFQGRTEYPAGSATPITIGQSPSGILGPGGQPVTRPTVIPGRAPDPVISAQQSPTDYLAMKRQFGKDWTKFDHAVPLKSNTLRIGNEAYGAMAGEFNSNIPDAKLINQKMQSLIPVRDAAQRAEESAGPMERAVDRMTRPTGGAAATLMGLHAGGMGGALSALGLQEALSSPTVRLAIARAMYGSGKGIKSPLTAKTLNDLAVAGNASTSIGSALGRQGQPQ